MKLGIIQIVIATLLFATNALFIRNIPLNSPTLLWVSILMAWVLISFLLLVTGDFKLSKPSRTLLIAGPIGAVGNSLFFAAIMQTTVANAVLAHYLAPVFIIIAAPFTLREIETKTSIIAAACGFVGLFLLLSGEGFALTAGTVGILLGVGSAFFFAAEIEVKRKIRTSEKTDTAQITWWYLLMMVLVLLPFVKFGAIANLDTVSLVWLGLFVLFPVTIGILLINSGIKTVQAHHAGTLSYLEPLGAIALATIFLGEPLNFFLILGGGLILLAGILTVRDSTHGLHVLRAK